MGAKPFDFGGPIVWLDILSRAGNSIEQPELAQVTRTNQMAQHQARFTLSQANRLSGYFHRFDRIANDRTSLSDFQVTDSITEGRDTNCIAYQIAQLELEGVVDRLESIDRIQTVAFGACAGSDLWGSDRSDRPTDR